MSALIQLYQGSKSYGAKELFKNAGFSINEGEHVGVIGPNGAGKTTLFKILTDQETLDTGELVRAKGLRVGYLAQHDHWREGETVEQFLSEGVHMPIWDLKALGVGLGLEESIYERPITSLSGGYRMRCKLLHLLGQEPDLLLLDEPTNYLDLESLLALERFLQGYRGAFLLISHDREFLRRTTDHILEVEAGDIIKFNGALDDYFEQKEMLRAQLESRALSLEQKRKEVLDFVARFGAKATKASQAQSRLKNLDRMEKIEIKALPSTAVIRLPEPTRTGKLILSLAQADLGYPERVVLKGVNFTLERGDHLAVVGVNGAGKSTFLKVMAGRLDPQQGELKLGHEVSIGYYAQHVSEALDPRQTVAEAMGAKAHPSVTPQQVLNLAGALLFAGDDVKKRVSVLSGGEKSRVALGQILLQKAPCLILDEPTNHLDFQTVEALTQALVAYPGTVVVVSHDRSFIGRIGTKVVEIRDGRVDFYPGTYDEYVWSCQKGARSKIATASAVAAAAAATPAPSLTFKEEKKTLERDLRKAEREQAELEERMGYGQDRMKFLNAQLAEDSASASATAWIEELGRLQRELETAEERWLHLGQLREELSQRISSMKEGR